MSDWLESTYRDHRERLFRVAWLILRDSALSEDAVHAAFVKLAKLKKCPDDCAKYVYRAVRNVAIDERRRLQRRENDSLSEWEGSSLKDERPDHRVQIEEMLNTLSDHQREVVELRLRLGMSFQEIASLLNEPLSTISSRYQRSIDRLRQNYEVYDG